MLKFLVVVMLSIFSLSPYAYSKQSISVVIGLDKPPYSINDGDIGFEVELISNIFNRLDYEVEFITAPFGRTAKMLELPNVDAVTTASVVNYADSPYISDTYITYQNVAVSLRNRNIKLAQMGDLSEYSIATFQNADTILGPQFAKAVHKGNKYIEIAEQKNQLSFLEKNKADLLVMDINIFNFFNRSFQLDVAIHEIFPPTKYGMLIKDPALKTAFNEQFKAYQTTEEYNDLLKKWGIALAQQSQ
ncbi:substrate-binding periplasmic protein [Pseudoalteromonas sp. SSDWG2]|uniref:substrate-binding periplasmic protein n=1 Tax=Pseudoalteromonas sp. SSDWG2 TaxID=3139391 RepID=UPI003BA99F46